MPFIPHTEQETAAMLKAIGVDNIDQLFDEIPKDLRVDTAADFTGLNEIEISNLMQEYAAMDGTPLCFAGGGAYNHHIPAAVWEITTRGEFYSAYTPYQAEASQGTLQLLYEYQTMMTRLMQMDVSNASLYDGASALAEAILMAVRLNRKAKNKKILIPKSTHPAYRKTVKTIVGNQGIELIEIDYLADKGTVDFADLKDKNQAVALVISLPNYFGMLEDVDKLTDWAHEHNMLVIGQVNPMAVSVLKPPGAWGKAGADIACGEGQPLGVPLSSGGPYFGFLCCKQNLVRQMPGRIIGRTTDLDGKSGFTLTLQAREQHIRRSKATSNICTNQGLMATAATIYMSIMGAKGLAGAAVASHTNTQKLINRLGEIKELEVVFTGAFFNEVLLKLPVKVADILKALAVQNIVGGIDLSEDYPELDNTLLVCATEKTTAEQINKFAENLERILSRQNPVKCNVTPKNF